MVAPFRFGRFELSPASRQLLVDGQPAALGARAFDVLHALIERRERLVTKNELLDLVWPGLVVEENNLQVQISSLRKLLGPQVDRDDSRARLPVHRRARRRGGRRRECRGAGPGTGGDAGRRAGRAADQPSRGTAAAVRPRRGPGGAALR